MPNDIWLFRAINGLPDSWSPFLSLWSTAPSAHWFNVAMLLLVIGMLWRSPRSRATVLKALISVAIGNKLTDVAKDHLHPEPRPFQVLSDVALRVGGANTHGTASAHAANMAAVAVVFLLGVGYWGVPWVIVAVLVGISRVYVGVHFPHQVLYGWLIGLVTGLLVTWAWDYAGKMIRYRRERSTQDQSHGEPEDAKREGVEPASEPG